MQHGHIEGIFVSSRAGAPMRDVQEVMAIVGAGLEGDRYCSGAGSWNKDALGNRQVTFINGRFIEGSGFAAAETRRNVVTRDVELMWLIGREFQIGEARFRGVKYCDPCKRPAKLAGKKGFAEAFHDRGGLIAEVIASGIIRRGDVISYEKEY